MPSLRRILWTCACGFPLAPLGAASADGHRVDSVATNAAGVVFIRVAAGEFMMGSAPEEPGRHDDETRHAVRLTRDFWIGAREITQRQWSQVMGGGNPSKIKGPDLPVTDVAWADAARFCARLSQSDGRKYRLPTEAEWERACRAGADSPYCGPIDEVGWHAGNSGEVAHAVGGKRANGWGLHDMHGNAMEWCSDWYQERLGRAMAVDPVGPEKGEARVARGGSFRHHPRAARAAARQAITPSYQYSHVGFRVVME